MLVLCLTGASSVFHLVIPPQPQEVSLTLVLIPLKTDLFYVYEDLACMYGCALHVCLVPEETRRGRQILGLELMMVVSRQAGAGKGARFSERTTQCS